MTMGGKGVVKVAATQQACTWDVEANLAQAEAHVRAAAKGEAAISELACFSDQQFSCLYG